MLSTQQNKFTFSFDTIFGNLHTVFLILPKQYEHELLKIFGFVSGIKRQKEKNVETTVCVNVWNEYLIVKGASQEESRRDNNSFLFMSTVWRLQNKYLACCERSEKEVALNVCWLLRGRPSEWVSEWERTVNKDDGKVTEACNLRSF